jgi:tetraacyldisaccharide 4'-kinase
MKAPAFWWEPPSFPADLAAPLAWVYGAIAGHRMSLKGRRAAVPVVCIGNFTLGGAGKTPTALMVAQLLARFGHHPAFLSRGYGGSLAGPVAVMPSRHLSSEVGDEPLLLAREATAIVARDRPGGASLAVQLGASVIVMDDGFQNPALEKDVSLVVVDAQTGIGNGFVFPAGPLRAPFDVQLRHAGALVLIGDGEAGDEVAARARQIGRPVFTARLAPDAAVAAALIGQRVLAYAGIGRPEKFFAMLESLGARLEHTEAFPDHHPYRPDDARRLVDTARRRGLALVTTEKDLARLAGHPEIAHLAEHSVALPVRLVADERDRLAAFLMQALAKPRAAD